METNPVTAHKKQYLAAMGIDVWVHRSRIADLQAHLSRSSGVAARRSSQSAQSTQPAQKPATQAATQEKTQEKTQQKTQQEPQQTTQQKQPARIQQEAPHFSLALLHYGSLGLCLSMAEGETLPRIFCDDVARAAGGDVEAVKYQQLDWPMVNSATMDQSIEVARQVVAGKLAQLPNHILFFGPDLPQYIEPLASTKLGETVQVGKAQCLLLANAADVMASGEEKRKLWHLVRQMIARAPA